MCTVMAGGTTVQDLPALEEVVRLFQLAGKIGRLFAWVKINFFPVRSAPLAKEGVINANLATVLKMAGNYLKEADRISEGGPSLAVSSLLAIPWLFPVGEFALWVTSAQTAHRQVSCDVMAAAVEQLHDSSLSLHEMVPPFESLFADGKVDLKLAANILVDWPRKSALGKGCSALEKAITAASISHYEWGLEGTLRDNAAYASQMTQIAATHSRARQALITTAGVNCLARLKGAERLGQRDKLLPHKEGMPKALHQLLEKLK